MKIRLLLVSCLVVLSVPLIAGRRSSCFYKSESTSGMNKICIYECITGNAAITIKATQLCPIRIDDGR